MAQKIDNYEVVIDSRMIVARVDELLELKADHDEQEDPEMSWDDENRDESDELDLLTNLLEQLRDVGGDTPEDGQTLVRESYFEDYAQELWEDTKDHDAGPVSWPYTCIDWEWAARELRMDYTSVEFDGITYYVR